MEKNTLLYLSYSDVKKAALPVKEIFNAVEKMFFEKGEGRVEMPPKPGIYPKKDSFIHAMPAYVPVFKSAGIKWVSAYPENKKAGLPYISGLIILNDPETGIPLSVMDCGWITAKRTAAATAVAAKYLARKNSSNIGILGCGVQGRTNVEALCEIFPIKKVKAYDTNPETANSYADEVSKKHNVQVEVVSCAKDAVCNMDIVVTAGPILKDPSPAIKAGWLSEGSFACPLDFDSYWQGEAFAAADKLATDDLKQIEYYRKVGYFGNTPVPYTDLGQIVSGKVPGRESEDEITFSINLGLAAEDMAVARKIYEKAERNRIGTILPL